MTYKIQHGSKYERIAELFLIKQKLKLICRNYRCGMGEIDLIMSYNNEIVFVEVRARTKLDYCTAEESIGASKRRKLMRTAAFYLQNHAHSDADCRFDVVAFNNNEIVWLKNAFECV